MTIDEIHIKVRQDVQKIDSHANGNLLDEEIDFHLNYYTRKFVDGVVGKLSGLSAAPTDFQRNQRLLDSISTLQVRNYVLPAYIDREDVVYGILPPNYRHLIEDVSDINYNCKGVTKNQVDARIYTHTLSFLADYETFSELELKIEGDVFFKLTDYLPEGITDPESKYQLVNLILDNTPYNIYWEHYDGKYFPRSFIFADYPQFNISFSITFKNEANVDTTDNISVIRQPVLNKIYRHNETDKFIRRPNRLTKDNTLNYVLNHPFEKTIWESPVSTLGNDRLYVHENSEFKTRTIIIDYIKRPIEASKIRSVNVELPDSSTQLVVEQTILHLKGMIQDPTWQTDMQHNNLTNQ